MRNQIPGGGSNPPGLPPGIALGSGIPRGTGLNGSTENTGQAAALIGAILNAGGQKPGRGGPRAVEKPSLAPVLLFLGGWAVILLAVKNLRGCKWK